MDDCDTRAKNVSIAISGLMTILKFLEKVSAACYVSFPLKDRLRLEVNPARPFTEFKKRRDDTITAQISTNVALWYDREQLDITPTKTNYHYDQEDSEFKLELKNFSSNAVVCADDKYVCNLKASRASHGLITDIMGLDVAGEEENTNAIKIASVTALVGEWRENFSIYSKENFYKSPNKPYKVDFHSTFTSYVESNENYIAALLPLSHSHYGPFVILFKPIEIPVVNRTRGITPLDLLSAALEQLNGSFHGLICELEIKKLI